MVNRIIIAILAVYGCVFASKFGSVFIVDEDSTSYSVGVDSSGLIGIKLYDSNGNGLQRDGVTNALRIVDYDHHEIHSGSHFFIDNYDSLNANDTASFGVFTRDTSRIAHIVFVLQSTAATRFFMYEGSTFDTTTGTAITPINNNRNSANTSSKLFRKNPTFSAAGTLLARTGFGAGTNPASSNSGMVGRSNEINLKQNTYYRLRVQSLAANNIVSYIAEWYEHISLE